jgi:hypothetical protein
MWHHGVLGRMEGSLFYTCLPIYLLYDFSAIASHIYGRSDGQKGMDGDTLRRRECGGCLRREKLLTWGTVTCLPSVLRLRVLV